MRRFGAPPSARHPDVENSDIHQYFRGRPAVIPHCDQRTQQQRRKGSGGTCVFVTPSGAVVHGRDLHNDAGNGKQMLMDMMLRGVIADITSYYPWKKDRWVSFLMVYTASGPIREERFPVLGFGKREPDRQPGLLIPNPFFVTPRWWDGIASAALQNAAERPWRARSNRVLFRGACGPGAHARFRLLRLADPEHRLDVGFTAVDGYKTIRDCVVDLARRVNGTRNDVDTIMNARVKPHVPQSNFSYYRYLLHMPGSATGSYSRNLQYLWSHGAIVLIWRHTATEWYYTHLRDGVHYVSVDETNLYSVLQRLESSPSLQLKLRRGGRQFAFKHLSGRTLVERWHSIMGVLQDRQAGKRPPIQNETACTCDADLLRRAEFNSCEKCEITLKSKRRISQFVGVLPKSKPPPQK